VKLTKANVLTLWRVVTAPVFLVVWHVVPGLGGLIACLVLASLSEISDGLDGYFARRDKTVSVFGKLIDPYADSVFRLTVFFCFAANARGGWIPVWMPVLLFYRDVLTGVIRTFAMRKGIAFAARYSGKFKAISQAVALIMTLSLAVLFGEGVPAADFARLVATPLTGIVVVISLGSGIDYFVAARSVFSDDNTEGA